jgi:hypothetical protein
MMDFGICAVFCIFKRLIPSDLGDTIRAFIGEPGRRIGGHPLHEGRRKVHRGHLQEGRKPSKLALHPWQVQGLQQEG